jgi:hypothetical protein
VLTKTAFEAGSWRAFTGELVIARMATQMIDNLVGREEK